MDFDNLEDVRLRPAGGVDEVAIANLSGTGIDHVDVDLLAFTDAGDLAADRVIVAGTARRDRIDVTRNAGQVLVDGLAAQTRITGSEKDLDTLRIDALAGDDDVFVAPDVAELIGTVVDLGTE